MLNSNAEKYQADDAEQFITMDSLAKQCIKDNHTKLSDTNVYVNVGNILTDWCAGPGVLDYLYHHLRSCKIWVSGGLIPDKIVNSVQLEYLYHNFKLNVSETITSETNVLTMQRKIQQMKPFMSNEQCIYLNLIDEGGVLKQKAIENMIAIQEPFSDVDYVEVTMDSCIMSFAGDNITDIEHIFPSGTVRNCPYIPYTRNMNNIPKEDYCRTYCPHIKK